MPSQSTDVEVYLKEISRYPLLTPEEEQDLTRRARAGDEDARQRMVQSNLRLVVSIAKNYVERGLAFLDLVEEGNLGLLKAVERFDPDKGCKFSTYASWWIKQGIRRALINKVKDVRVPAYMVELIGHWRRTVVQLTQELSRAPRTEEIARHLDLPVEKIRQIQQAMGSQTSLFTGEEEGCISLEHIQDQLLEPPEEEEMDLVGITRSRLDQAMSSLLADREEVIVRLRYGFNDRAQTLTLEEIGEKLGLTRERVRQLERHALRRLWAYFSGEEMEPPSATRKQPPAHLGEFLQALRSSRDRALTPPPMRSPRVEKSKKPTRGRQAPVRGKTKSRRRSPKRK